MLAALSTWAGWLTGYCASSATRSRCASSKGCRMSTYARTSPRSGTTYRDPRAASDGRCSCKIGHECKRCLSFLSPGLVKIDKTRNEHNESGHRLIADIRPDIDLCREGA